MFFVVVHADWLFWRFQNAGKSEGYSFAPFARRRYCSSPCMA